MLLTCDGCGAKIRAPDSAAGKRVKCPKCATIVTLPEVDKPKDDPDAEAAKISTKPMPPPPPIEEEPLDKDEKTKVTSAGAKPPKIKPQPAGSIDDDEDEDDRPVRKRRRMDEGEDDYLAVRSDHAGSSANAMSTAAMVLGIFSILMSTGGVCCCSFLGPIIAIICGGLALTFGFMSRAPGSNGTALTGIICGGIGLALGLMMLVLILFVIGLDIAGQQGMFNFNPKG
jgi:predicted Zn finger-like uncharacterized protein